MKNLIIIISVIIYFFSCSENSEKDLKATIPQLIVKKNLVDKYMRAKWEVYKYNFHDSVTVIATKIKIPFVICDLGINSKDVHVNDSTFLVNDTLKTIYLYPSYKDGIVEIFNKKREVVFGASFKNDTIKYLPNGDKSFLQVVDSISKLREIEIVKYIQENKDKVNPWLIEYVRVCLKIKS